MTSGLQLHLRSSLLLGPGVILLVATSVSALAYRNTIDTRDATARVRHSEAVIESASAALLTVDDMDAHYREYLRSGTPEALTAYQTATTNYPIQLAALTELTRDNPAQVARWQAIKSQIDAFRSEAVEPGIAARQVIAAGTATDRDLVTLETSATEWQAGRTIRESLAKAAAVEHGLLQQRIEAAAVANEFVRQVLAWGTLATVLLGLLVVALQPARIGQTMRRLATLGQTIAAREASEARYKHLVANAPDIIYRTDARGRFTFVNSIARAILGWSEAELEGKSYLELVYPDDRATMREHYARQWIDETPSTFIEFRVCASDGRVVWIAQNVRLIVEGQRKVGFQGVARDITDRKLAREALARLQQQTQLILDSAAEGICSLDRAGRLVVVNPSAARLSGYTVEQMLGQDVHALLHHSYADGSPYPVEKCQIYAVLADSPSQPTAEVHRECDFFWRSDGSKFPFEYTAVPTLEDGQVTGAVVTFHDISERQAMERMKDEFISVVSHELRTPLTGIRGSLGLLRAGLLGPISDQAHHMLDLALSNTDRLVRLINDILDIERIESGGAPLQLKQTDAREVVSRSIDGIRPVADAVAVELVQDVEPLWLVADSDRLQQTLTNLLGNAIKFSPNGSRIDVRLRRDGNAALFSVQDRGLGIPVDRLHSVFARFEQVDASDSRRQGGTGLGLAICRSIVEQHGGRIWVDSSLGQGSTFYFTIPMRASGQLVAEQDQVDSDAARTP